MNEEQLYELISSIESKAYRPTSGAYWLDCDTSEDYCYSCAAKTAIDRDCIIDGGWSGESDNPARCNICGELLSYTLTNYGVENELSYFEESGFNIDDSKECYEILRIYYGISKEDEKTKRLYNVLNKISVVSE